MINERLYLLEILRFVAAFTIMYGHFIVHYIFFEIDFQKGFFPIFHNPYGSLSVPFFFMMSGAIFAMKYGKTILKNNISIYNFTLRRIARLYPLHIITLLVVALTQFYIFKDSGKYYYIENNDVYHFILNIFFASDWGFQRGNSFNSPFWSVSHEFLIYVIFYFVCRNNIFRNKPIWQKYLSFLVLIFLLRHSEHNGFINLLIVKVPFYDLVFQSMFTFFSGALLYEFTIFFNAKYKGYLKTLLIIIILFIAYISSNLVKAEGIPFGTLGYSILFVSLLFDLNYKEGFSELYQNISLCLGGISYSIYLIHMPIIFIMGLIQIKYNYFNMLGLYTLLSYLVLCLILGLISFNYFEKPLQKKIINIFTK